MARPEILKLSFEWSQKLGVRDLPQIDANHQSNVRGLYVVGDLADAPIIKVALNQGYDVAQKLAEALKRPAPEHADELLDVVVIGAGPAGIGAALALEEAGLRYVLLERERPFSTIQNFPKAKQIFSEPRQLESKGNFWFEDASKEDLIERWEKALDERSLQLRQPEEVLSAKRVDGVFEVETRVGERGVDQGAPSPSLETKNLAGTENSYRARRVILAVGRRGSVNKLGVSGEDLAKVAYALHDPAHYAQKKLLVIGGGDSALEAAIACAEAGAEVTLSYRGEQFSRAKGENRQRVATLVASGEIRAEMSSQVQEIGERHAVLTRGDERVVVDNDAVLIFIGTRLPQGFLKRLGVRMAGQMDIPRALWVASFALLTYLFYLLKSKKAYFPFGQHDALAWVPKALEVDLGFRSVGPSFWGTSVYALLILIFGIRAYRKYPAREQKRRYLSLILFQWFFLFGIPEIIAPAVIHLGQSVPELLTRGYKFYAISVPWPLSVWSMVDGPGWGASEGVKHVSTNIAWVVIGAATAFLLVPLYVRRNGQRFCSYLCGCGGLAETLGDFWRHLAPRGKSSQRSEVFGRIIFLLAIPVTLLILNDAWGFFAKDALYSTKAFATHWYSLMVDFWLASVLGVALYPYLGNRVWCRFFCPLRAYMELLARRFARITIKSNNHCIGCGECTRFCQMGIQVQKFAQKQQDMDNSNSSCIQCGICVQVCPMEVLSLAERDLQGEVKGPLLAPSTGP